MNTYEAAVQYADPVTGQPIQRAAQVKAGDMEDAKRRVMQLCAPLVQYAIQGVRLVVGAPPAVRYDVNGQPDTNYTVEEATRFLTCTQPVERGLLSKLGKDCSMVARIQGVQWTERPTPDRPWPTERAYPFPIILEVFRVNPATAPYIPKG